MSEYQWNSFKECWPRTFNRIALKFGDKIVFADLNKDYDYVFDAEIDPNSFTHWKGVS